MRSQTSPIGFQDLFRLKNFGRNPDEVAESILTTVDALPFWGADRAFFAQAENTSSGMAAQQDLSVTIPDGEVWFPHLFTAATYTATATGPDCTVALLIEDATNAVQTVRVASAKFDVDSANETHVVAAHLPNLIGYLPGTKFTARTWGGGALGNWRVSVDVGCYRFTI